MSKGKKINKSKGTLSYMSIQWYLLGEDWGAQEEARKLAMTKLFPNVSIYQTGSTRIEITAKNISKASAINLIKNDYEKVVVFGDSGNDIEMFNCADVSYCMSSAPEYVKLEADYIVDSFFDAVNHYIELDKKNKS